MWPYILVFILLSILAYYFDIRGGGRLDKQKWRIFVIILLILFSGLRNRVGSDTINYMEAFADYPTLGESFSVDWDALSQPLWFFINVILKTLFNNFLAVQLFQAIVFHILLYKYVCKKTNCFFTVMLFVFCMVWWDFEFEILRESLCIVIVLNASLYLNDGNIKKYLLLCLPALFIHAFSFIMIAFILLLYYCNEVIVGLISIAVFFLIMMIPPDTLIGYLVLMSSVTGDDMRKIVEFYLTESRYGGVELNIFGILYRLFLLGLPILLIFSKGSANKLDRKMLILYSLFSFLTGFIQIFSRFTGYLTIPLIICGVNYLFEHKKKTLNYIGIEFFLVFYLFLSITAFFTPDERVKSSTIKYDCRYIPYKSVFQDPDPVREMYYGN